MKHLSLSKTGRWTVRLSVPEDVRSRIGKREFKQSLGEISRSKAEVKATELIAIWKRMILTCREEMSDHPPSTLDSLELTASKEQIVDQTKRSLRYSALINDPSDTQVLARLRDQLEDNFSIDLNDVEAAAFFGMYCLTGSFVEQYVDEELRPHLKPRSVDEHRNILLNQFVAHFPVLDSKFTIRTVSRWWDALYKGDAPKSPSTLTKYRSHCSAYMAWLIKKEYCRQPNYFQDLQIPKRRRNLPSIDRKPFDDDDIASLWMVMSQTKKPDTALQHLFLMAAYTGCRIEELCQLQISDVHQLPNGRLYLDIPLSKTAKGEHRKIPLHKQIEPLLENKSDYLIELGRIDNQYNERSSAIGKRFGRLKSAAGFGPDKVFHSLRKSFTDKLKVNRVPEQFAADILGHEIHTMSYGVYGSATPVQELFGYVDSVSYPALEALR